MDMDHSVERNSRALWEALFELKDNSDDLRMSIEESLILIERSRALLETPVYAAPFPRTPRAPCVAQRKKWGGGQARAAASVTGSPAIRE